MRLRVLLVAGALTLFASGAMADEAYDKCIDANTTNTAWAQCGGDFIKREDDKLNAAWKTLSDQVSGQTKTDLLAEQRLWNSFKEASCKFHANGDWGREGQVLAFPACRAGVIAERTKALNAYIEGISPQ
ncbi:MAG: DUF1311 domain-containing protein [Methylobacterium mesophilicum]|nr:DUF1311 domain-containing protein [Methylobacterium mesophilicum]